MTGTVLILGANGRFGRAATQAFANEGWNILAATRTGAGENGPKLKHLAVDAADRDALCRAAQGADVIVHAVHPPYPEWAKLMPVQTANVIAAGLASGATVMIPGNVYVFDKDGPALWSEEAAPKPSSRKGALRVAMEQSFADAAAQGLQTILLRGGDFIERRKTGNWFENHIAAKAHKGKFTYPGAMDLVHAWAYLPDMARAMALLAARRKDFAGYTAFGFEGYSLTGAELMGAVQVAAKRPVKSAAFPWLALRLLALVNPLMREVLEMRYLWDTPHRLDGSALRRALPDFEPTPLEQAMAHVLGPAASA